MSGPLSVPFAGIALYIDGRWQKVLFGVLAIVCAFVASYRVWRRERVERMKLANTLVPRLDLVFDSQCRECRSYDSDHDEESWCLGVENRSGVYVDDVRVLVHALEPGFCAAGYQLPWSGEGRISRPVPPSSLGHVHAYFLSRRVETLPGEDFYDVGEEQVRYTMAIAGGGWALDPNKAYTATVAIEGNTAPVVRSVRVTLRDGVSITIE